MTTSEIQTAVLQPQPTAVVRGYVGEAELPGFLGSAFGETARALTAQHRAPAGPPFARYRVSEYGFDVEAGFPSTGPITATGSVEPGELPGGPAAEVTWRGDYRGVAQAYEATARWIAEHGYAAAGDAWEAYLDEPGVAEPRTVVRMPYRTS